jgi:large subunit ribosomal protein L9
MASYLGHDHALQNTTAVRQTSASRAGLRVVAQRAVTKKVQVVLTQQIPNLGNAGDLKSVPVGHYRNYLQPQGLAAIATESILAEIEKKQAAEERAKLEDKAKAQAMATALSTIGKFIIKKKIGEEDQIFGSVSAADVVEAIRMQTGRDVDKRNVTLPDIKTLGTYDCTVKLHAEVVGSFKVVVQKDTSN